MIRLPRMVSLVWLFSAIAGYGAGLPDTGQDTCYNDTAADIVPATDAASIARDTGTHPRQDCRYGQDAAAAAGALTKTGAGAKGFDYTKIANNGATLGASAALGTAATDWACTKDNITGLTWEVKTATGTDLRYSGHTYTWLNTDATANGGSAGSVGDSSSCNATLATCNTQAFIAAVNAGGLCGQTDWRLPTRRELLTLVDADGSSPSIAPAYFPNTIALDFWSGSSYVPEPTAAWVVSFTNGAAEANGKAFTFSVRLVRGGPF